MTTATADEFETIAPRYAARPPLPTEIEALKSLRRACLATAWDCQATMLKIRWIEAGTAAHVAWVRTLHSLTFWVSTAGCGWGLAVGSVAYIAWR